MSTLGQNDATLGEFVKQGSNGNARISIAPSEPDSVAQSITLDQQVECTTTVLTQAERHKQNPENRKPATRRPDEQAISRRNAVFEL